MVDYHRVSRWYEHEVVGASASVRVSTCVPVYISRGIKAVAVVKFTHIN